MTLSVRGFELVGEGGHERLQAVRVGLRSLRLLLRQPHEGRGPVRRRFKGVPVLRVQRDPPPPADRVSCNPERLGDRVHRYASFRELVRRGSEIHRIQLLTKVVPVLMFVDSSIRTERHGVNGVTIKAEGGRRPNGGELAALRSSVDPNEARRNIPRATRAAIRDRYDGRCVVCETEGASTVDHVIPVSRGGDDDPSNLQLLCRSCNSRKGNLTMAEFRPPLFRFVPARHANHFRRCPVCRRERMGAAVNRARCCVCRAPLIDNAPEPGAEPMTRTEARQTLDQQDAAIARNVDDLWSGRIDYAEFDRRQRAAHRAMEAAGQSGSWARRQRRR